MEIRDIKNEVRTHYAGIARQSKAGCCGQSTSCCGSAAPADIQAEDATIAAADLGLGCGLPAASANIRPSDTVLDLGSGAGVDVFRAARLVGPGGHVIGIDMTPEMIERAYANARAGGFQNVEFRLGDIEALPIEDSSVDVVLSNCVINLAPDKSRVFNEIHRVLKPGGHFSISDVVTFGQVPAEVRQDVELWAGCIAGAMDKEKYLETIVNCGFSKVTVLSFQPSDYPQGADYGTASITIEARK